MNQMASQLELNPLLNIYISLCPKIVKINKNLLKKICKLIKLDQKYLVSTSVF